MGMYDNILFNFGWILFLSSFILLMVLSIIYIFSKFFKKRYKRNMNDDFVEDLKKKNKVLDFPKVVKKKEEKKKKYWMLLSVDTTIPGLGYGMKTERSSAPFKKVTDNVKIKNFVSWYNRGTTPFFCLRFSNGDMTFVERKYIVGFKVTFGEDEE